MNDTARAASANSASQRRTPWWVWTLAGVGAAGVVAFLVVIGLVVVPPALANLRTQVASAQDPLVIGSEAASVVIAVPDGWLITHPDDAHTLIATPDRGMIVDVTPAAGDPSAAAAAAGVASPLAAADEDAANVPALVAAVGPVAGGSVVFTASSDDLDRYRPALASLLEGVRP